MFPTSKSEAEQMFWQTPELVQGLLPFLDLDSTLRLAQAHEKTQSILQGSRAWRNLIKRNSPLDEQDKVKHLVTILKLMEDTESNMLDLQDTICEANPSIHQGESVQISCPRHPDSHSTSVEGFLLLENVEGAFGTTEQTIENIRLDFVVDTVDGPLLSALASRLSRQQQKLTTFNIGTIELTSKKAAEDFKILMQASSAMTIQLIRLDGANLGTEGFGWVAEGPQSHPGLLLESVYISKSTLERGKLDDLRVLWDALRPDGFLVVEVATWRMLEERLEKGDGEAAWTRLCQIRDEPAAYWIKERMRFEVMLMIEAEGWDVQDEEDDDEEVEEEEEDEEEELGDEDEEQGVEGQGDESQDV